MISKYKERFEKLVIEDAQHLEFRAAELSGMKLTGKPGPLPDRFPNAERVAQLRGWANHLRAMSAERLRARYMP